MASLQKVKVGRQSYYRIVESRRVNGKPRPVPILHLGTADQFTCSACLPTANRSSRCAPTSTGTWRR